MHFQTQNSKHILRHVLNQNCIHTILELQGAEEIQFNLDTNNKQRKNIRKIKTPKINIFGLQKEGLEYTNQGLC